MTEQSIDIGEQSIGEESVMEDPSHSIEQEQQHEAAPVVSLKGSFENRERLNSELGKAQDLFERSGALYEMKNVAKGLSLHSNLNPSVQVVIVDEGGGHEGYAVVLRFAPEVVIPSSSNSTQIEDGSEVITWKQPDILRSRGIMIRAEKGSDEIRAFCLKGNGISVEDSAEFSLPDESSSIFPFGDPDNQEQRPDGLEKMAEVMEEISRDPIVPKQDIVINEQPLDNEIFPEDAPDLGQVPGQVRNDLRHLSEKQRYKIYEEELVRRRRGPSGLGEEWKELHIGQTFQEYARDMKREGKDVRLRDELLIALRQSRSYFDAREGLDEGNLAGPTLHHSQIKAYQEVRIR